MYLINTIAQKVGFAQTTATQVCTIRHASAISSTIITSFRLIQLADGTSQPRPFYVQLSYRYSQHSHDIARAFSLSFQLGCMSARRAARLRHYRRTRSAPRHGRLLHNARATLPRGLQSVLRRSTITAAANDAPLIARQRRCSRSTPSAPGRDDAVTSVKRSARSQNAGDSRQRAALAALLGCFSQRLAGCRFLSPASIGFSSRLAAIVILTVALRRWPGFSMRWLRPLAHRPSSRMAPLSVSHFTEVPLTPPQCSFSLSHSRFPSRHRAQASLAR